MATEVLETYNVLKQWKAKEDLILDYKDLMEAAGVYVRTKAGMTLTEEQKKINKLVEDTTSFNINIFANIFYSKYGKKLVKSIVDDFSKNYLKVNSYKYSDIIEISSLAMYGVDSLTLSVTDEYKDKILNSPKETNKFEDTEIYFTVEDPVPGEGSHLHTLYYKFSTEENESEKDLIDDKEKVPGDSDNIIDLSKFETDSTIDIIKDSVIIPASNDEKEIDEISKFIYINSLSLYGIKNNSNASKVLETKSNLLHVHINQTCPFAFTFNLKINVHEPKKGTVTLVEKTYQYTPVEVNISNVMGEHLTKMNNPDVSFALLRTNPKLTGNVKVMVDSDSNIYLDTFKISDTLSQRKYRHISVGSSTYYGNSLMTRFKDLPTTEFYKIPDRCYSLFTPAQTHKNEYFDVYNSGVSTNSDELYSENFSIFAPLCIRRVMPDFFLVFKVNRDAHGYDEVNMSDNDKINFFMKYGKLVKSYDLRKDSNVGKYIRNIYEHSKSYIGDMFASYDTDNYNKFIGISLDKGVVTAMYESPYEQEKVGNQVALNDFFTKGFERNHIVSKDIINFEFLFDDTEDEMFSVNTYFGLYVRLNKESETDFSCIGKHVSENDKSLIEYDFDSDIHTFDTSAFLSDIPQYESLIYGVATPTDFTRLNVSLKYSSLNSDFLLKPYKNILTTEIRKVHAASCKSFITIKANDVFDVGDHIRIIVPELKTIYEIIMSDADSLETLQGVYTDEYRLTEVITNYYNENSTGWTIKRISMFIPYKNTIIEPAIEYNEETGITRAVLPSAKEMIKTEIEQLFFAFKKFGISKVFTSWKYNDDAVSVISNYENTIFERICSVSGFVQSQYDYLMSTDDEDKTLEFFGSVYPEKTILNIDTLSWKHNSNFYLYPIHFELVGTRMAYIVDFVKTSEVSDDYIYTGEVDDLKIFDNKSIVYLKNDVSGLVSTLYNDIHVTTYKNDKDDPILVDSSVSNIRWINSFDNLNNKVLNLRNPRISNNQILLYNTYPINCGVCSILQVKDFDFEVLDNDNALLDYEPDSVIGGKGEYSEKSIFNITASDNEEEPNDDPNNLAKYEIEDNTNFMYVGSGKEQDLLKELNSETNELKKKLEEAKSNLDNCTDDDKKNELQKIYDVCETKYNTYISTEKTCVPILDTVLVNGDSIQIYNMKSMYYKCKIHYVKSETGEGQWKWAGKEQSDAPEEMSFNISTGYSKTPLRNTSEESIKNYIDKYGILDQSITDKVWYGNDEEHNRSKFLEEIFNKNHMSFDISLTAPYCCKWKSVGTDARGGNLRLMYYDSSIDVDSYYIVGPDKNDCSTYIGYLYTPANDISEEDDSEFSYALDKKYITRSIDHVIKDTTDGSVNMITFKDFILNGNGSIDDMIYNANIQDNRFSTAYMSGANTLEFISGGVKIRIKSNNDNIIDFNQYVGYPIIFITLPIANPDYNKNTELIIDEIKHEIVFIWYNPTATLKMGYMQDPVKGSDDADKNSSYLCPITLNTSLGDLVLKYIRENTSTNSKSFTAISIPDYLELGKQQSYFDGVRVIDNSSSPEPTMDLNKTLKYRASHLGKKLANKKAYLYLSSINIDDTAYTRQETGAVSCELLQTIPQYDDIYKTFPYYHIENYITGINPLIWFNNECNDATNSGIEDMTSVLNNHINAYLITDDPSNIVSSNASYKELSKVINNCVIYVKTDNGLKDFTNVNKLLDIDIVDPLTYYKYKNIEANRFPDKNKTIFGRVHSTYAEPVMKNIFDFDFSTRARNNRLTKKYKSMQDVPSIDSVFNKSFDGANVSIKNINAIPQVWINKYTEVSNYCQQVIDSSSLYRLSIDVLKDVSVIQDTWAFNTYRKYNLVKNNGDSGKLKESYTSIKGYKTGYELKSFFNSKAVVLNGSDGNTIEITSWKNTEISNAKKYIKLNVTDSLIYNILFRPSFSSAWKYLNVNSNDYKINYIKNTVLNFININNKTKFVLSKDSSKKSGLSFITDYNESDTEVVTNFTNELKYENGKYYMYIYPEDTYTYYAKMIITL